MKASANAHDWHCKDHDTYGWRGEACRLCPEAPDKQREERESVEKQLAAVTAERDALLADNARLEAERDGWKASAENRLEIQRQREGKLAAVLWLYALIADNKPLPKGTRINTTEGGIPTGGNHELSDNLLKAANKVPNHLSDYVPFWILGWRDLHGDLLPPIEADQ
jgi:hypothetical protein